MFLYNSGDDMYICNSSIYTGKQPAAVGDCKILRGILVPVHQLPLFVCPEFQQETADCGSNRKGGKGSKGL
jgi:hypothetical protein